MALILDQISMISLKLLSIVDIYISQVKSKITNNDTAVSDSLALVIIIGDFYQIFQVVGRFLWTHLIISEKIYGKSIWNQFTSVISLTKQM